MMKNITFTRLVAVTAILSALLALGCLALLMFLPTDISAAMAAKAIGAQEAELTYWAMLLDMFGYYLLVAPSAIFLWYLLKSKNHALASLFTLSGLGYILIGSIGAAILAAVLPHLFISFEQTTGAEQETVALVIQTVWNTVYGGLWNLLEVGLSAVWWIGIGWLLRSEYRLLSIVTIILGVACLIDTFGNIIRVEEIAAVGLYIYLVLSIIWQAWVGIVAWRSIRVSRESIETEPLKLAQNPS